MAKKSKYKKNSKNKKDKKTKQLTKEEIKDLKKNLLVKSENKNEKVKKSSKKNKKEKEKKTKKEIKDEKIIKAKIKKVKDETIKEEKEKKIQKIKNLENGGIIQDSNNQKEKNISSSEKGSNQTLLQLIKNKENTKDVNLNDENYSRNKNNLKKGQKKNSIDNKLEEKNAKNQIDDKNEYIKKLKSKIVMVNGRMVMEKPDVGLINKKYNEEHSKNISAMETVFVNNDEKVVNSLSFIDIKPTKKWTDEENKLFYKAIELFGLDFSMIEIVLKKRTRAEIKRKFLKEKKENYNEMEKAINSRKNIVKLKQILDLYKNEKGQNYLGLFKEESFRSRRNILNKEEKIDYEKEYKNVLNNK